MAGGGWLAPLAELGAVTNENLEFLILLLLSDTQFAGKEVLLVPSGVLRVVAVLWFPVQHGSCPPEALLCCVLT